MKKYSIIIILLVALGSCTKKVDSTAYLLPGTKEHYFFKEGSYWIYRDSISGRMDSCYLVSSSTFTSDEKSDDWPYEHLVLSLIQKPIDTNIKDELRYYFAFKSGTLKNAYTKSIPNKGDIPVSIYEIRFGHSLKDPILGDIVILPKYNLGVHTFDSVLKVSYLNQVSYLNDSVGNIKMQINYDALGVKINEVWELQRWHIVK